MKIFRREYNSKKKSTERGSTYRGASTSSESYDATSHIMNMTLASSYSDTSSSCDSSSSFDSGSSSCDSGSF